MNSIVTYDPLLLKKAIDYLNSGIEMFPNRLDIRFGKCFVLGEVSKYTEFTNEIMQTVEYSTKIKCNWLWAENKKVEDPENFMLGSIQSYLKQLYETEADSLVGNMIRIGDLTILYYPHSVEILSTTSVAYMLRKDYDKAIVYLKQAEAVNPKDYIVLANIAQAYKRKGDKENAIKYFQQTMKYANAEVKADAKRFIEELQQK